LRHFYPTSVLVTGRDIIFFWVARMVFMGLTFMPGVPFREVFIHGLVLDAQGRKMSKSLGNGVDPIEVIEQYGADTLRFMLVTGNAPGNDLRFQVERLEGTRNFANKIWNASRFVLMNLDRSGFESLKPEYAMADRWILSRYQKTVRDTTSLLARFEIGEAARVLYDFIWSEFCDWYIELAKPRLYGRETEASKNTAQMVLSQVLGGTLKLLHPFMPFITEEIWHHLQGTEGSISVAMWPKPQAEWDNPSLEKEMELVMDVIRAVRNMRAETGVLPGKRVELVLVAGSASVKEILKNGIGYINQLAGAGSVRLEIGELVEKPGQAAAAVVNGVEIYLPLAGLIDLEQEIKRLSKELVEVTRELERTAGKLKNQGFFAKAPQEVIEKEKIKQLEYAAKKAALEKRLKMIADA